MTLKGLLLLITLVLVCCGIGPAWDMIKNIAIGLWSLIKALPQFIVAIAPLTDIGDWIKTRIIYIAIICLLSWGGFVLSKRSERKLLAIISGVIGFISTVSLLFGISN